MNERKGWTQYVKVTQEDESLVEIINQFGSDNWTSVADLMSEKFGIHDRSGKKCRERWINHLKPDISKAPWTEDEIKILIRSQAFYGNQWTEIAKFLPGRTDNSVKNIFYTTLRKKIRLFNKSCFPEEIISESIHNVSLNPELTEKLMKISGKKNANKNLARYYLFRRTSARLHDNKQLMKDDLKVELPRFESFNTCSSMGTETFSSLPKVLMTDFKVLGDEYVSLSEIIEFDFSRYLN